MLKLQRFTVGKTSIYIYISKREDFAFDKTSIV